MDAEEVEILSSADGDGDDEAEEGGQGGGQQEDGQQPAAACIGTEKAAGLLSEMHQEEAQPPTAANRNQPLPSGPTPQAAGVSRWDPRPAAMKGVI